MARIGILGYPNVGKTTLLNALTGLGAVTAAHPFSTQEPNVGMAVVPDALLDRVAEAEGSAKVVHASLELVDIPAMVRPGHGGGLVGQFLAKMREMEALAVVVRSFESDDVPDDESGTDPSEQAQELLLEMALADHEVFERRARKIAKEATADPAKKPAAEAVAAAAEVLTEGTPLRAVPWTSIQVQAFRDLAPLTMIPSVWVINTAEDDDPTDAVEAVSAVVPEGDVVVAVSARLEEEASQLPPEDRAELFEGLGMGEGVLAKMVGAAYSALGVQSFYTLGPKEAHAWTVRVGATAPQAAGKIHSDLERGFIRAEITNIEQAIAAGGWDAAKKQGLVRVEGKSYVMAEGDVILVRFSV